MKRILVTGILFLTFSMYFSHVFAQNIGINETGFLFGNYYNTGGWVFTFGDWV